MTLLEKAESKTLTFDELCELADITREQALAVSFNGFTVRHSFSVGQGPNDPSPVVFRNAEFTLRLNLGQLIDRSISAVRINYQNKTRKLGTKQLSALAQPVSIDVNALNERIASQQDPVALAMKLNAEQAKMTIAELMKAGKITPTNLIAMLRAQGRGDVVDEWLAEAGTPEADAPTPEADAPEQE